MLSLKQSLASLLFVSSESKTSRAEDDRFRLLHCHIDFRNLRVQPKRRGSCSSAFQYRTLTNPRLKGSE